MNYRTDIPEIKGYIDKEKILDKYDEEDIFSLVFGFRPTPHQYVTSPFRKDNSPECRFHVSPSGKLRFLDFGNTDTKYGIKLNNIDCFDAVQVFFKISNFYLVLKFIDKHLSVNREHVRVSRRKSRTVNKAKVELYFQSRNFTRHDAEYWSPYGISKQNLIDDNVFPVSDIFMKNTRNGDVDMKLRETCYALTGFEERLKFYFPYRQGHHRFITNCNINDIGHVNSLPPIGRQLIMAKSYKDRRVLVNTGRYSCWNQNEGMQPDDETLFSIVKGYKSVIVFYDNDRQGIQSSLDMMERINSVHPNKARAVWLPESLLDEGVKDPADLRKRSEQELRQFLKYQRI